MKIDRSNTLIIGCGGCGCNQIDTLMDIDNRYNPIYMNTNLSEMINLKHFDMNRRCFYVTNADGSGKDRNVTEKYLREDVNKFLEMIVNYINQNYVIFFGSMNGGTGSKAMIMLSKLVKKVYPNKSINIIATFPDLDLTMIDYENTLDTWNDLIILQKQGVIDSLQFIDNSKGQELDIELNEINKKAMQDLDDSFDIISGNLDTSDFAKAMTMSGYKVLLKLEEVNNLERAVKQGISNSVYYIPETLENINSETIFECSAILGNISKQFKINSIHEYFKAYDFSKFTYGDKNMLLISGCDLPTEGVNFAKEMIQDLKKRKSQRGNVTKNLMVDVRKTKEEAAIAAKNKKSNDINKVISKKNIKDIFNIDFFD